jgi:beta-mannosidase
MARVVSNSAQRVTPLSTGWSLCRTPAGAASDPFNLRDEEREWIPAQVPGTAAQALAAAGKFDPAAPAPLDDGDVWYRMSFHWSGPTDAVLHLDGLATLCDVWLNGKHVVRSENMFHAHARPVSGLARHNTLHLKFSALNEWLKGKKGRVRWKPRMVQPTSVRFARTTLLGRCPSWSPAIQPVGPWRGIWLEEGPLSVVGASLRTRLEGQRGVVQAKLSLAGAAAEALGSIELTVGGETTTFRRGAPGEFSGTLELARIEPWWPHTHGTPQLYPVSVATGSARLDFGSTGFRSVQLDRWGDGFLLKVNGERVFCRGACWTTADLISLAGTREAYAPWLQLARDAGMNMLRVPGVSVYESPDFFALCDALGILVWQDFMFANFDYPVTEPGFRQSVEREAREVLSSVQLSPSLAVLCGGSEVEQQAAMLGVAPNEAKSPLEQEWLPNVAAAGRPDVPYVTNSPTGGPLPFVSNAGCAHYYGVGAYFRPLEDVRRAEVKFASECLGIANLAERPPAGSEARVPKDLGASYDFADVRDFYLKQLYRVEPAELKEKEPARYAALSADVSAEVMEATFGEWRRLKSSCNGGLVWFFQDVWPAPGWGVVDSAGIPKAAWYGLKRAFAPQAVFFSDEGVNGLAIHVVNDRPEPLTTTLKVELLLDGRVPVGRGERKVSVPPRGAIELSAFSLLEGFLDVSNAFRFGPSPHHLTVATLLDASGAILSEAFHFPVGRFNGPFGDARLSADVHKDGADWVLTLTANGFVQSVRVECDGYQASDRGFHLLAGRPRELVLKPHPGVAKPPRGNVHAVTLATPVEFETTQTPDLRPQTSP